jgi:hypothetical protein
MFMWVRARLCKLQKRCTWLAAANAKVYQLLVHGRWFSPGTPASSTTNTGRHDIAEILLKVALNTINRKSYHSLFYLCTRLLEIVIEVPVSNYEGIKEGEKIDLLSKYICI